MNITNPGMTKSTQMAREYAWPVAKTVALLNVLLGRTVEAAASNYVYATIVMGNRGHGGFARD